MAFSEGTLGRFAGEISGLGRPASIRELRNESGPSVFITAEWAPGLPVVRQKPRCSHEAIQAFNELGGAEVYTFPYLALIRAALRDGEVSSAKKLLDIAVSQDRAELEELTRLRQLLGPAKVRRSSIKGVDRAPEFRWLTVHGAKYEGQWVAVSGDHLVAHAQRLKDLLSELKAHPLERQPLIHKIS